MEFNKIMSIKINYSNKSSGDLSSNTVLFSDEKFNTSNLRTYLSGSELSYINEILNHKIQIERPNFLCHSRFLVNRNI